ncbi:Ankyrin-1 [Paramyrothecium foliicola]|nr:Ankyrin-1 [Paramyrothecium foliicola]
MRKIILAVLFASVAAIQTQIRETDDAVAFVNALPNCTWAMNITNIILDVVVLVLPIPLVIKMKSTLRRKVAIIFMFSLGVVVLVASCLKMRYNIIYGHSTNITWDYMDLMVWAGIESSVSVAAPCLPTVRLFLHRIWPSRFGSMFAFGAQGETTLDEYIKAEEEEVAQWSADVESPTQDSSTVLRPRRVVIKDEFGNVQAGPETPTESLDYEQARPSMASKHATSSSLTLRLLNGGFNPSGDEVDANEALLWAAKEGNSDLCRLLIEEGADVNSVDERQRSVLHLAAKSGSLAVLRLLKDEGADADAANYWGQRPLHHATGYNHVEAVRFLLGQCNANVELKDNDGWTPLIEAARQDNCHIVHILVVEFKANIHAKDNDDFCALQHACHNGHLNATKRLIDLGSSISWVADNGDTLLHTAASADRSRIVKLLIELGVDARRTNKLERTPVHNAAMSGASRAVAALLESSEIELDCPDKIGDTALSLASYKGFTEIVRLLVRKGARMDVRDEAGDTPLHSASRTSSLEVIEFLLESGADIEARNNRLETPLLFAAQYQTALGAVRVLESRGADIYAKQTKGYTALHKSIASENRLMVRHFLRQGLDVEAQCVHGQTPLSRAAELGHADMVSLLLEHGADMETEGKEEGKERWRPLHYAAYHGHLEVVETLLDRGADGFAKDERGNGAQLYAKDSGHSDISELIKRTTPISKKTMAISGAQDHNGIIYFSTIGDEVNLRRRIEEGSNIHVSDTDGMRPLIAAAKSGVVDAVRLLLDHGANIDETDGYGMTALLWASQYNNLKSVEELLSREALVDLADSEGQTPLSAASMRGHTEVVHLLLEHGANPNSSVHYGKSPLLFAAAGGHLTVVEALLDKGADIRFISSTGDTAFYLAKSAGNNRLVRLLRGHMGRSTGNDTQTHKTRRFNKQTTKNILRLPELMQAVRKGRIPEMKRLLVTGLDLHGTQELGIPIICAAQNGQNKAVRLLISKGADLNARDEAGSTALHAAARQDHADTVRLLCDHGSALDYQDKLQRTPLLLAAENGNQESLQALLSCGARLEVKCEKGRTALGYAASGGYLEAVQSLCEAGANLNAGDQHGYTPLSIAVDAGEFRVSRLLLERGARMRPLSSTNLSPLCLAVKRGFEDLVELLLQYGADINHLSDSRQTPLMKAAQHDHGMVATILVEMGAKVHLKDDLGRTAMSYAKDFTYGSVISVLCQAVSLRARSERAVRKAQQDELTSRMKYEYEELPKNGFIRIMELHAGRGGDIISFDLINMDIHENPSFEALSYEWRDSSGSIPVQCGQGRILVTANCKSALERLRLEGDNRFLWIDAICIDQDDKEEVNQQVALMTDIFRKATNVILWLGPENDNTKKAFAVIPELSSTYMALLKGKTEQSSGLRDLEANELYQLASAALSDKEVAREMKKLYYSSYFGRAWIFQEIILAGSRGIVMSGKERWEWTIFRQALQCYQLCTGYNNPCFDWIIQVDDLFTRNGGIDVTTTISAMVAFEASDPRDKVFATLRLGSTQMAARQLQPPAADYTKTIKEVYVGFARYYAHVWSKPPWALGNRPSKRVVHDLPSWVPDCSSQTHSTRLRNPFVHQSELDTLNLTATLAPVTTASRLHIEAYIVDEVVFKASITKETDIYELLRTVIETLARHHRGIYAIKPTHLEISTEPTSLKYTNFDALLEVLFQEPLKEKSEKSLETSSNDKSEPQPDGRVEDADNSSDDWSIDDSSDESVTTSSKSTSSSTPSRTSDQEIAAFLIWMLSRDDTVPEISRYTPPLELFKGYLPSRWADENNYLGMFREMEDNVRYDTDLVYTRKGLFGLTNHGEAEQGLVVACFPQEKTLSLLRHKHDEGDSWYEYVDDVYFSHVAENWEQLEKIGLGAERQWIQIC